MITGNDTEVKGVVVDMWGLSRDGHNILYSCASARKISAFVVIARAPMFKFDVRECAPATRN